MPVRKTCEKCNKGYSVPPSRATKARFCSPECCKTERRKLTCKGCGVKFTSVSTKGAWPKFCSRKCFLSQCVRPKEKPCASCGNTFVADGAHHASEDGFRKYCSQACAHEGLKRGEEYACLNCGVSFHLSPVTLRQRGKPGCCSRKCQTAFYTGARSAAFVVGFYTHTQTGDRHLLLSRPGYVGKYVGENRVVASREIGRPVRRGEYVIRINRDPEDNRPKNLFICESNSEFSKRRSGSLPWPTKSNLKDYLVSADAEP